MPENNKIWFLIAYDVVTSRRLKRIHRLLCRHGIPVQQSVFLVLARASALKKLEEQCCEILNLDEDDLAIIKTDSPDAIWMFGKGMSHFALDSSSRTKSSRGEGHSLFAIIRKKGRKYIWKK